MPVRSGLPISPDPEPASQVLPNPDSLENHMAARASLCTLLVLLPALPAQTEQDKLLTPSLSKSDLSSLNRKVAEWIQAEVALQNMPENLSARRKSAMSAKMRKARDDFMKVYESKFKKGHPLGNVGNALSIFDGVFEYERQSSSGAVKALKDVKPQTYFLAPRRYNYKESYRVVLQLPSLDESGSKWVRPRDYMEAAWAASALKDETLVALPQLTAGNDYDGPADLTTDQGTRLELNRIQESLVPLGYVMRQYNVNRRQIFLDCGKGSCGFGLRLATYFPTRFAGIILRHPTEVKNLRLENILTIPMLLVSNAATKATCDKIKETMTGLDQAAVVTIVDDPGDLTKLQPQIDEFCKKHQRPHFPSKLALVPNHDRFNQVHWAQIITAEPLDSVNEQDRPTLKIRADREKNQIIIDAQSVSQVGVYLNDLLVDLDKEVTFVINGKETEKLKFERNPTLMLETVMRRFDATQVFSVYHRFDIPTKEKQD